MTTVSRAPFYPSTSSGRTGMRRCMGGGFGCLPHVRPPRNGERTGEVGEDCLRPRRGRVPQPPVRSSTAGKPEGPAHLGRLFFGYFLLAKQKKVTCRRAAPGDFALRLSATKLVAARHSLKHPRRLAILQHSTVGILGTRAVDADQRA